MVIFRAGSANSSARLQRSRACPSTLQSRIWVLLILLVVVGLGALRAEEPPYFAIHGARIVTVSGPVIEKGTVVIAKGLIVAVGPEVPIPPEAWVIDGKGLTVYPGLIDALTDLGLGSAAPAAPGRQPTAGPPSAPARPQQVSRGPEDRPATTPWVNPADELKTDDKRLETWRNAGFTSALTAPKLGIFPGQGAVINLAGERPGEMVVKSPATLNLTFHPMAGFANFPDSLMGVRAYIEQVFLDANQYAQAETVYDAHPRGLNRPTYDRTALVVADTLHGGRPVLLPANTAPQILRTLVLADRLAVHPVLYGVQQGYAVADTLGASKVPVLVSLKWPEKEKDADPDAPQELRELRFRDRAPSTPAALEKAGVKFAFYSDSLPSPKDFLKNAKKAIDAGLAADAALRAFTLSTAEILGVADQTGSIEPGKIANLVIADGDLFNEKTKVKMTFVDGRRYEVHEPTRPTAPPTVKLTGKWKLTVTSPEGPQEASADLTMAENGDLSGSVTGQSGPVLGRMGTVSISNGWVSGNKFSFTISLPMGGNPVDTTFSGTVEGDEMKGSASAAGASFDFTGSRPGGV